MNNAVNLVLTTMSQFSYFMQVFFHLFVHLSPSCRISLSGGANMVGQFKWILLILVACEILKDLAQNFFLLADIKLPLGVLGQLHI